METSIPAYNRRMISAIREALADTPVVCLLGPRQCGKTTLVQDLMPDRAYTTLDDEGTLTLARTDPSGLLRGLPAEVTFDEIQQAPMLLRAIKLSVDRDRRPGRFLLTGSANLLLLPQIPDSLAGRMEVIFLHPLTEAEKNGSPGAFLSDWMEGKLVSQLRTTKQSVVEGVAERVTGGGYPEPLTRKPERAARWHRNYVSSILERDVADVARIRDVRELSRLLDIMGHRTAELLNVSNLSQEIGMDRKTVEQYLSVLERLFLVRSLPAWHRSEVKRLVKTPKIHIVDSGLAATLSGLKTADWLAQRDRFGHLLESFVVQQLIAQGGWTDPALRFFHYRDKDMTEVDVVMTQGKSVWGAEVKASASIATSDGKGLRRLAQQCGKDFKSGVVFYSGTSTVLISESPRILAVPISELWER
jgi:predicted AAA+ superfamily ATPase